MDINNDIMLSYVVAIVLCSILYILCVLSKNVLITHNKNINMIVKYIEYIKLVKVLEYPLCFSPIYPFLVLNQIGFYSSTHYYTIFSSRFYGYFFTVS